MAAVILLVACAADFDYAGLPVAAAALSGISWSLSRLGFAALDQLMWRGYLQATAAEGIGFWPAAWVLTIAFTAEKLLVTRQALPLVAFLAWGLLSALMLRRTGSLWFGWFQLGLDWGMIFLYGLATQGTSAHPTGTLMSASAHNALFTGTTAGMRSSVVMPALIGLAAVFVHFRFSGPSRIASPPHQQA